MLENVGDAITKLLRIARAFVFIKLDYILLRRANAKLHARSCECVNYRASAYNGSPLPFSVIDKLIKRRIFINVS